LDLSRVTVRVQGTGEGGADPVTLTLAERDGNVWSDTAVPAGSYTVEASNPGTLVGAAPVTVVAGQLAQVTVTLGASPKTARRFTVHFRFDSAFVEPCMRRVLEEVADEALVAFEEKLLVVGHTDESGSGAYNQSLSERRARSVFAMLTFGRSDADRARAIEEWEALRRDRSGSGATINDAWGVREYQHMLQDLRFYPGAVDGVRGPLTRDAVRAYRCSKGLPDGDDVDDATWTELIIDYLDRSRRSTVLDSRLFPNCDGEVLKWLGCGEQDPILQGRRVWRPNRRTELLLVNDESLPCQVPEPVTFALPQPGAVATRWCLGPGDPDDRCCFAVPAATTCAGADPRLWCRQRAREGTITVTGTIRREMPDGTLEPVPGQRFVLLDPDGRFWADEGGDGEGQPARTARQPQRPDDPPAGSFEFPELPPGFYHLEVITPPNAPVLVKLGATLDEVADGEIRGNSVCKLLTEDDSNLDVIIVNAPVLREIRLPVAVHLMTALEGDEIRRCTRPAGEVVQTTSRTRGEVQEALREANRIWRQARVRFELTDMVRATYAHSQAGRCEVDRDEFNLLLDRCAYSNVVNVLFFGDLEGESRAGFGLSFEDGVASGRSGCAVTDRIQSPGPGAPHDERLTPEQLAESLAHVLGLYLDLDPLDPTPDHAGRLMLRASGPAGGDRELVTSEVERARSSRAASPPCVPLSLSVTGATRMGGSLSDRFLAVRSAGEVVVEAVLPTRLLAPGAGTLTLNGQPVQRLVIDRAAPATTEVTAVYTPASGGEPMSARVIVHVTSFELEVEGARESAPGSGRFVTFDDPTDLVRITAELSHRPFCIPDDLIDWTRGLPSANPQLRLVRKEGPREVEVSATVTEATRSVTIAVTRFALRVEGAGVRRVAPDSNEFAAVRGDGFVTVIAEVDPLPDPLPPDFLTWQGGQEVPGAPLRRRVRRQEIDQTPVRATIAGTTREVVITVFEVVLTRHAAPLGDAVDRVQIEGIVNAALGDVHRGNLLPFQRASLFRARASVPGRPAGVQVVIASLISERFGGGNIEPPMDIALRRTAANSDHFLSLPILAVSQAIDRTDITLPSPPDLEVARAQAGGRIRLDASNAFQLGGLGVDTVRVRGRVVHLFVQSFADSGINAQTIRDHIARANRIWAQAGVEIKERVRGGNPDGVRAGVPTPAGLTVLDTLAFPSPLTDDERRLLGILPGGPTRSDTANDLNIYYVQSFINPETGTVPGATGRAYAAESYTEIDEPDETGIAISGSSGPSGELFAHEIGHHLLREWPGSEHQDLASPPQDWPPNDNVMRASVGAGSENVHPTQVQNIADHTEDHPHVLQLE